MSRKLTLTQRFACLFRGLERAHGRSSPLSKGKKDPKTGKQPAKAWTILEPVTETLWQEHLEGKLGLGITPIDDDANTPAWGCIDVDVYDLDVAALAARIESKRLPLVVCGTKSGGAHVFLFLATPAPAQLVRTKLTELAIALDFPGVEVFPKQVTLAHDRDVGNWLNLPYFGDTRHAMIEGRWVSLEAFLDHAEKRRLTADQLLSLEAPISEVFADGPPCLQQLATHGFPDGTRNNAMFNLGIYTRLRWPDDWERHLEEYNHELMDPPLTSGEVQTIVKSLRKKEYRYKCEDQPIVGLCNKGLCLGRRYGVAGGGGDEPHDVQLGGLTKYLTDPPTYILDVDGHRVQLNTEELLDHGRFRKRVFEALNKLPPRRKPTTWDKVIQELASTCQEVDAPADASAEGRIWQLLEDWCTQYAQARTREELLVGKPWTEEGRIFFRANDFQRYLEHQGVREIKGRGLWAVLKMHGATHGQFNLNGRCVRFWSVPVFQGEDEPEPELEIPRRESQY